MTNITTQLQDLANHMDTITDAAISLHKDDINTGRAVYSTDKGRHFVQVDSKHLYEFNNEHDAVNYANRINGVQS